MTTKRVHNSQLKALVYKAPSSIHGAGLFAAQRFKANEYIGTYAGPIARRNGRYVLWIRDEEGSETGVRGVNLLRYLNHASKPNAYFAGMDLFAAKRIASGNEITFDYGWDEE